jgi:hypothetical protein
MDVANVDVRFVPLTDAPYESELRNAYSRSLLIQFKAKRP